MIKVIASDMDGTLLGDDHRPAPETLAAIREACDSGIRFMIATGRNFPGAMAELEGTDLVCDYIVSSGAEVRDPGQRVVSRKNLSGTEIKKLYEILKEFPVSTTFCTDGPDYRIGTLEEVEDSMILQLQKFHSSLTREELKGTPLYQRVKKNTRVIRDFSVLEENHVQVYKLFIFSDDLQLLARIRERLKDDRQIAVASSFSTNLEITDIKAQKGPVLKEYIESLGYSMDEVMVFGDSLNDYSMLSMDFGATVAMENAVPEVKKAAKYITRSNTDLGVAYAIRELLKRQTKINEKRVG